MERPASAAESTATAVTKQESDDSLATSNKSGLSRSTASQVAGLLSREVLRSLDGSVTMASSEPSSATVIPCVKNSTCFSSTYDSVAGSSTELLKQLLMMDSDVSFAGIESDVSDSMEDLKQYPSSTTGLESLESFANLSMKDGVGKFKVFVDEAELCEPNFENQSLRVYSMAHRSGYSGILEADIHDEHGSLFRNLQVLLNIPASKLPFKVSQTGIAGNTFAPVVYMLSTEGVLYKTEPDSALENFDFNLEKIEMPHSVKIRSFEAAFAGQHIFCIDDQSTLHWFKEGDTSTAEKMGVGVGRVWPGSPAVLIERQNPDNASDTVQHGVLLDPDFSRFLGHECEMLHVEARAGKIRDVNMRWNEVDILYDDGFCASYPVIGVGKNSWLRLNVSINMRGQYVYELNGTSWWSGKVVLEQSEDFDASKKVVNRKSMPGFVSDELVPMAGTAPVEEKTSAEVVAEYRPPGGNEPDLVALKRHSTGNIRIMPKAEYIQKKSPTTPDTQTKPKSETVSKPKAKPRTKSLAALGNESGGGKKDAGPGAWSGVFGGPATRANVLQTCIPEPTSLTANISTQLAKRCDLKGKILAISDDFIITNRFLFSRGSPAFYWASGDVENLSFFDPIETRDIKAPEKIVLMPEHTTSVHLTRIDARTVYVYGHGDYGTAFVGKLKYGPLEQNPSVTKWQLSTVVNDQENERRIGIHKLERHEDMVFISHSYRPKITNAFCLDRDMRIQRGFRKVLDLGRVADQLDALQKPSMDDLITVVYGLGPRIEKTSRSGSKKPAAEEKRDIVFNLARRVNQPVSDRLFELCLACNDYVALVALKPFMSSEQIREVMLGLLEPYNELRSRPELVSQRFEAFVEIHRLDALHNHVTPVDIEAARCKLIEMYGLERTRYPCGAMAYQIQFWKETYLTLGSGAVLGGFMRSFECYLLLQHAVRIMTEQRKEQLGQLMHGLYSNGIDQIGFCHYGFRVLTKWQSYFEKLEVLPGESDAMSKFHFVTKFPQAATEICLRTRFITILETADTDAMIQIVLWLSTSPFFTKLFMELIDKHLKTDERTSLFEKVTTAVTQNLSVMVTLKHTAVSPMLHGFEDISSQTWGILDGMIDGAFVNHQKICLKKLLQKCLDLEEIHIDSAGYTPIFGKLALQAGDIVRPILDCFVYPLAGAGNYEKNVAGRRVAWGNMDMREGVKGYPACQIRSDSLFFSRNIYNSNAHYVEEFETLNTQITFTDGRVIPEPTRAQYHNYKELFERGDVDDTCYTLEPMYKKIAAGFHSIISLILELDKTKSFKFDIDYIWSYIAPIFENMEAALRKLADSDQQMVSYDPTNYLWRVINDGVTFDVRNCVPRLQAHTIIFDILLYLRIQNRVVSESDANDTATPAESRISVRNAQSMIGVYFRRGSIVAVPPSMRQSGAKPKRVDSMLPLAREHALLTYTATRSEMFGGSSLTSDIDRFRHSLTVLAKAPHQFHVILPYSSPHYSIIYRFVTIQARHVIIRSLTTVTGGIRVGPSDAYRKPVNCLKGIDRANFVMSVTEKVSELRTHGSKEQSTLVYNAKQSTAGNNAYFVNEPKHSMESPYLYIHYLNEKGYGPGVDISFFRAFGEKFLDFSEFELPLLWKPEVSDGYLPVLHDRMNPVEYYLRQKILFTLGYVIAAGIYGRSDGSDRKLWQRCVGFRFSRPFSKLILGHPVKFHDVAFFDQELFSSLRNLLNQVEQHGLDAECFGLDFSVELPREEGGHTIELCPNGESRDVTNQNMYEYVELYTTRRMVSNYEDAAKQVRDGMRSYLNPNLEDQFQERLSCLDAEDLSLIMAGERTFDVDGLKKCFRVNIFTTANRITKERAKILFCKALDQLTNSELFELWVFWTGRGSFVSSESVPYVTFETPCKRLSEAATCSKDLTVYDYATVEDLVKSLRVSIKCKDFGNY